MNVLLSLVALGITFPQARQLSQPPPSRFAPFRAVATDSIGFARSPRVIALLAAVLPEGVSQRNVAATFLPPATSAGEKQKDIKGDVKPWTYIIRSGQVPNPLVMQLSYSGSVDTSGVYAPVKGEDPERCTGPTPQYDYTNPLFEQWYRQSGLHGPEIQGEAALSQLCEVLLRHRYESAWRLSEYRPASVIARDALSGKGLDCGDKSVLATCVMRRWGYPAVTDCGRALRSNWLYAGLHARMRWFDRSRGVWYRAEVTGLENGVSPLDAMYGGMEQRAPLLVCQVDCDIDVKIPDSTTFPKSHHFLSLQAVQALVSGSDPRRVTVTRSWTVEFPAREGEK